MGVGKTILVVDDDPSVVGTIELVLMAEGYEVLSANNGETGIELAKQRLPNAIILDVSMPKMNGYLFATLLSRNAKLRHIPILLLTGLAQMAGGITLDVPCVHRKLSKPFDHMKLLKLINELTAAPDTPKKAK